MLQTSELVRKGQDLSNSKNNVFMNDNGNVVDVWNSNKLPDALKSCI